MACLDNAGAKPRQRSDLMGRSSYRAGVLAFALLSSTVLCAQSTTVYPIEFSPVAPSTADVVAANIPGSYRYCDVGTTAEVATGSITIKTYARVTPCYDQNYNGLVLNVALSGLAAGIYDVQWVVATDSGLPFVAGAGSLTVVAAAPAQVHAAPGLGAAGLLALGWHW